MSTLIGVWCKTCIHNGVCYTQETSTDESLTEWLREFGCDDYKATGDVQEVRHGEWMDNCNGTFTCSLCGGKSPKKQWCGDCGAKMRGDA